MDLFDDENHAHFTAVKTYQFADLEYFLAL
jgi:hypothetical protein